MICSLFVYLYETALCSELTKQ